MITHSSGIRQKIAPIRRTQPHSLRLFTSDEGDMAKQWVGCMVSIKLVNDGGTYQGEITVATDEKITLTKAFCDGIPCESPEVTVRFAASKTGIRCANYKFLVLKRLLI